MSGCSENRDKIIEASISSESKKTPESIEVGIKEAKPIKYRLMDIDQKVESVTTLGDDITFASIKEPLVLVSFISTWSPQSRAELPILSKIEKKYGKNIFVLGILIDEEQDSSKLRYFMKKFKADFFVSHSQDNQKLTKFVIKSLKLSDNFPIPLSVLYKNGEFYRFYEGIMPIEMMDYEIKQAIKLL